MIDATTALTFSMAANPGVYALLLGSGVSRSASIPTGWEIVLDLARRLTAAEGAEVADPVAWYRERFAGEPDYSALLAALAGTALERRALLHAYIEPSSDDRDQGRKTPTEAHRAIARLVRDGVVRVIVTTNFDRLIETALREEGVEPTVVSAEDGVLGMPPLIHLKSLVVKVHGDYLDTRILNTDGELAHYAPVMDGLLDRIFDEHGLLICGWSGEWDPALRAAITRAPNRRYPVFWASRRAPGGTAADLLASRDGRWVPIQDSDSFFQTLQDKVAAQLELARPHPMGLDLLAAMTKRHLAASRPRVKLGDLLLTETRTALSKIDGEEVLGQTVVATSKNEEFHRRVDVFESATAPLIRMLEVAGRWGDGDETALALDVLHELNQRDGQSGSVLWLALGSYPTLLLWYAYGVGAAKAGRLALLHRWLSQPFRHPYDGSDQIAVRRFFLSEFEGAREGAWAQRGPTETRDPMSDAVRAALKPILLAEFASGADFDRAFERFEMLATLRHIEEIDSKEALGQNLTTRYPIRSPIGRIAIGGFTEDPPLIVQLKRPADSEALTDAGFFGGDGEWLTLALEGLGRTLSYPFGR